MHRFQNLHALSYESYFLNRSVDWAQATAFISPGFHWFIIGAFSFPLRAWQLRKLSQQLRGWRMVAWSDLKSSKFSRKIFDASCSLWRVKLNHVWVIYVSWLLSAGEISNRQNFFGLWTFGQFTHWRMVGFVIENIQHKIIERVWHLHEIFFFFKSANFCTFTLFYAHMKVHGKNDAIQLATRWQGAFETVITINDRLIKTIQFACYSLSICEVVLIKGRSNRGSTVSSLRNVRWCAVNYRMLHRTLQVRFS